MPCGPGGVHCALYLPGGVRTHVLDRLLASNLTGVLIAVALAVFAVVQRTWVYLEISMGLAVQAFVGTLAVTYYVERGRVL